MSCYLCRSESRISYLGYFCENCKKIQDLISCYGTRVHQVIEEVLIRTPSQQNNKIKLELKKEIESKSKQYNLRSAKKANAPEYDI